ncbi:MAG: PQQ-binding-like beta-propeller repeat protein [Aureliella sp.]
MNRSIPKRCYPPEIRSESGVQARRLHLSSRYSCALLAVIWLGAAGAQAEDWTQWRGQDRKAVWNEDGILEKFPETGLKIVWRKEIGSGYSGPVVAGGKIVTMDFVPKPGGSKAEVIERVLCLDESTGNTIWTDEVETHYREVMASYRTGPRATPTIDGKRVYTTGSVGHLRCLDLETGNEIWSIDSRTQYKLTPPIWGTSTSPIVFGDLVIFAPGGPNQEQVRAYDKLTGQERWAACPATYELGYSQFLLTEAGGATQLIYWDPSFLRGLAPETGKVLWEIPMRTKSAMSVGTPVRSGNKLLVSSFYSGSMLVELDSQHPTAKKLWHVQGSGEMPDKTKGLHCVITTPIIEGEHFYGTCSYGEMRGLTLEDSARVWENKELTRQGRWGSAFFIKHLDRYFLFNDVGELLLTRFTPDGPELIDRTQLIEPDTESGWGPRRFANSIVNWCHPAFANRHVIVRNDHEIIRASLAK